MNLYLIENNNLDEYDHVQGFVIAARNESEARNLAATEKGAEGVKVWLGGSVRSKIKVIGIASGDITKPAIILRSFNAG